MTTPSNIFLLYAARGVRGFGDGFAIIILPAYLTAIGYDPVQIGFVATASLLGTAVLTLAIGTIAPCHDLRTLLLAGAALMACTGLAFPNFEQVAFVALVAFVGTINPSTGDLGVLVPIEHAMLAHGVSDHERTRTFARYSLVGALSMAAGSLAAAVPDFLALAGIGTVSAFKLMFYAYAALGVLSALLYRCLPHAQMDAPRAAAPLGPSRGVVYKLSALFSLDAFAGPLRACSSSGRARQVHFPIRWRHGSRNISASSTPWSSPIFRPASCSSWRRFHQTFM
jgi:MFS family permease